MSENKSITTSDPQTFSLAPASYEEAAKFASIIAKSDLVPTDYRGKPENCMIAMAMGEQLGMPGLQAIQNIAVVNGRPSLWGDGLVAVARGHKDFEYLHTDFEDKTMTATVKLKRRGEPEHVSTFSKEDAATAKLWDKSGPWSQYPKRMLLSRARSYAIRDVFADALRGIHSAEEIIDIEPTDYSVIEPSGKPDVEIPTAIKLGDDTIVDAGTGEVETPPATEKKPEPKKSAPNKPEPKKESPKQEEPEPKKTGDGLTEGMIRTMTSKAKAVGLPPEAIFGRFKVNGWDGFDRSQANEILKYIDSQATGD